MLSSESDDIFFHFLAESGRELWRIVTSQATIVATAGVIGLENISYSR